MGRFIPNEQTVILFTLIPPGGIESPDAPTVTSADTGGTLTAATYTYSVVALNAEGNTLPSATGDVVVSSGSTNANTVTWTAVTGATAGYDVYGRTAGVLRKLGHIAFGTETFVDTGSVTPTGVPPNTNTTADIGNISLANDVTPAIDLTDLTMSFNASSQGNAVPTPSFARLFETSIIGTSQATFTADFYRDDEDDLAWNTLPRGTFGWFIVTRYGGEIAEGDSVEVWPVAVLSRAMANMANNTVVSFTVTCAVPEEPNEDSTVGA